MNNELTAKAADAELREAMSRYANAKTVGKWIDHLGKGADVQIVYSNELINITNALTADERFELREMLKAFIGKVADGMKERGDAALDRVREILGVEVEEDEENGK